MTTDTTPLTVPVYQEFMNPCLDVLRAHAGAMSIPELDAAVAERMRLSPDVLAVVHNNVEGGQREAFYRLAWARSYLKKMGYLANPSRGRWEITEKGRAAGAVDARELARLVVSGASDDALAASVPEPVAEELLELVPGAILSSKHREGAELAACYARFRAKFGPDVLRNTHGESLLELMHGRATRDSLVYWLEFKNDADMPAVFGSIAGGSALKFGIYQSADDSSWKTGSPTAQVKLSVRDAVRFVEEQRDQLVRGTDVLAGYSPETADYDEIELRMAEAAPDLSRSAWGHKYFSLLFPELLDDYHNVDYQQYHLIKLHKLPSAGRYQNARFFAGIARQLGIPISHLAATLNVRDGDPQTVWRVGTTTGDDGNSEWARMREEGIVSVGWNDIGDLSEVERTSAGKDHVRQLIDSHYPNHPSAVTRGANQLFAFATRVRVGDTVVAMEGGTVLGIAEVTGDYYYAAGPGFAHRRPVRWLSLETWKLPKPEGLRTTFVPLKSNLVNLVEIARHVDMVGEAAAPREDRRPRPAASSTGTSVAAPQPLTGLLARIQSALHRKGQIILYGPPGTGKTYWAMAAMQELAARSWFAQSYAELTDQQRTQLELDGALAQCTFHPAYGYEDFLVGYRPAVHGGNLTFESKKGVFAQVCERALREPDKKFFLLIDEINRGDIPRIFGELITLLEKDKRGHRVLIPMLSEPFVVPPNVNVIGTMNTADRSIVLLDAALRRRFAFLELMPDSRVLRGVRIEGLPLRPWFEELNRRVLAHAGRDARNLQVGHSYFMSGAQAIRDTERFTEVLRDDVVPLLQEYCYNDFEALAQILGTTLVLVPEKRINHALFEPSRRGALFDALLLAFREISTTDAAAAADVSEDFDEDDVAEAEGGDE